MTEQPSGQGEQSRKITLEMVEATPNGTILSYNLNDSETPGGLKVRWKIRVISGAEAQRWDARQAEAIKELLEWAFHHPPGRPA